MVMTFSFVSRNDLLYRQQQHGVFDFIVCFILASEILVAI